MHRSWLFDCLENVNELSFCALIMHVVEKSQTSTRLQVSNRAEGSCCRLLYINAPWDSVHFAGIPGMGH